MNHRCIQYRYPRANKEKRVTPTAPPVRVSKASHNAQPTGVYRSLYETDFTFSKCKFSCRQPLGQLPEPRLLPPPAAQETRCLAGRTAGSGGEETGSSRRRSEECFIDKSWEASEQYSHQTHRSLNRRPQTSYQSLRYRPRPRYPPSIYPPHASPEPITPTPLTVTPKPRMTAKTRD
ncbi:hypothetical protein E2C01_043836 [Portunus trituberculatus]|uniref:Uncharacterized protein n=1 Tax=Portunus trituberculatus TaxID=210409 RepID=A0A5B7FX70_PORTR|nr:hypothetical protein [Portunus trituberculatus]